MRRAARTAIVILLALSSPACAPGHPDVHAITQPSPAPLAAVHPRNRVPPPLLAGNRPVADDPAIVSWTLVDVATNTVLGEHRCIGCTNPAASTVKVWLAGDALRRAGAHPGRATLRDADAAILDSDNNAATRLFRGGGGRTGLWRMVYTCHLLRTLPSTAWGETRITSGDLAALGVCATRGDVAGPHTALLLDRMRHVRGTGRFGPVDSLPTPDIVMKNGWIVNEGKWIVNCLAVVDHTWSLGILTRYPAQLGMAHGAQLCAGVARQLATPRSDRFRLYE